jgi:hypothetical protein
MAERGTTKTDKVIVWAHADFPINSWQVEALIVMYRAGSAQKPGLGFCLTRLMSRAPVKGSMEITVVYRAPTQSGRP